MLSNHAFNAMLKTLEEPPEYLKFILATTDPQKIPVTILSRCLQFSLKPMPPSDISQHLGAVLEAENVAFEPAALKLIARNAQGSMRDALSILDQAIAHGHGELMSATVQELLGAVDTTALYALMQALAAQDMARVLQNAKILLDQGLSAKDILQTIATLCSRLAVAHLDIDSLHAEVDEVDALGGLVQTLSPEHIQLMYGVAIKGLQDAPFAPDEYAAIAMPLIRMQVFAPSQQSVTAIAAPASSATIAAPASPATIAADNSATPAPTPNLHTLPANTLPASSLPTIPSKPTAIPNKPNAFSLKQPSDWVSIANSLPLAALARETARTSVCVGVDKLNLHLEVPVQDMAKPLLIDRIKQALRDATGQAWEIHMAVNAALGSTATAPANVVMQEQAAQSSAMQTAKDNLYKDPLVQALVQAGAQVVDASIRPA